MIQGHALTSLQSMLQCRGTKSPLDTLMLVIGEFMEAYLPAEVDAVDATATLPATLTVVFQTDGVHDGS